MAAGVVKKPSLKTVQGQDVKIDTKAGVEVDGGDRSLECRTHRP